MKKIKVEAILENIIIIFLIIQPIFDLKIFYNSISTLIRTVIIIVFFLIYFIKSNNKRKYLLLIYSVILGIYAIFHHINAMNFTSLVPGNFNYSLVKELLYFVKMIVPILLIYVLFKSKITNSKIDKIIQLIVFIMGSSIIITNLLGISYGSYSDEIIKANFIKWFNNSENYTYKDLASKGLFEYGNQVSAVLLMFLPFIINKSIKEKKWKNFAILLINVFSLILLSTRVAVIGIMLVFVYTIIIILYMKNRKNLNNIKIKNFAGSIIVVIIYISILPINPMFNRIYEMNNQYDEIIQVDSQNIVDDESNEVEEDGVYNKNNNNENNSIIENVETKKVLEQNNYSKKEEQIKYIQENYKRKNIHEQFILRSYPYQYDTEFWTIILNLDIYTRTNYRYIEKQMVKRVIEINNNKYDKIFGITHTRVQNIFNIEQDFIEQYYALGILGSIIIFLPYFLLITIYVYKVIKSKFKLCSIDNLLSIITIFMIFGIAYNSGNLLNSLSFTIYFAILYYKLYNVQKDEGGENVYKEYLFKFKKI